jgi:hypothetical protein
MATNMASAPPSLAVSAEALFVEALDEEDGVAAAAEDGVLDVEALECLSPVLADAESG